MNYVLDLGNVISEEEMITLRKIIRESTHTWIHCSDHWPKEKTSPKYFIGSPIMYPMQNSYKFLANYRKLRPRSEDFLNQYSISSKVLPAIEKFYNRPAEMLPDASQPGFEVYSSFNGRNNYFDSKYFHIDNCSVDYWEDLRFDPANKPQLTEIHASITPIELPKIGQGTELEYKTPEGILKTKYTEGNCYIWKSDMPHRPTYIELGEGELRICFILFFVLKPNKIFYYI